MRNANLIFEMVKISQLLDLGKNELISVMGSGGKTSVMFQLASELQSSNTKVITTTTTKIAVPTDNLCRNVVFHEDFLSGNYTCDDFPFVAGAINFEGSKLTAPPLEVILEFWRREPAAVIIVEADGSRGKPLKLYASYEPVLTGFETRVLIVISLAALGKSVSDEFVHRHELLDTEFDNRLIDFDFLKHLLFMPNGYINKAGSSQVDLIVNAISDHKELEVAKKISLVCKSRHPRPRVLLRGPLFGIDNYGFYCYRDF